MLSLSNFTILSSWNLILTSNVLCCVISKAAFNSGSNSWALFPSTQAGIFCGLAPWILRKQVHGAVIYKSLSHLLLLLVIKPFQMTNLLMAGVMLQIIFHTEELAVAAESSKGLGWWFLQRKESPPCAEVLWHQHHPNPRHTNQTWTLAGWEWWESRTQGLHTDTEFTVQCRVPVQFPWNQQGFRGKSAAEQQQSGHTDSMAAAGVTIPPLCSSTQLFAPSCQLWRIVAPSTGGRNLLKCALPIRGAGKYFRPSIYYG